jgi:thymidylate synthase ThyX
MTHGHGGAPGAHMSWKMPMVANMKKMAMASLTRARGFRLSQKSLRYVRAI